MLLITLFLITNLQDTLEIFHCIATLKLST